jgi:undecaprenyl diphosphate synthase
MTVVTFLSHSHISHSCLLAQAIRALSFRLHSPSFTQHLRGFDVPTLFTTNSCQAAAGQLSEMLRQGSSSLLAAALGAKPTPQPAAERCELPIAPAHITIAPGGHRFWAADRLLPQAAALIQGLDRLMETVAFCSAQKVEQLTFLAMPLDHAMHAYGETDSYWGWVGQGNYWRPALMRAVKAALNKLPSLGVRLRLEGEWPALDGPLMAALLETQARTRSNTGLWLNLRPAQPLLLWGAEGTRERAGKTPVAQDPWAKEASVAGGACCREPNLAIRTGGSTLSNDGMVWDTTQTALYFTNCSWPDFNGLDLCRALYWYSTPGRAGGMQVGLAAREHQGLGTGHDRA